jgi:hypothetical protein
MRLGSAVVIPGSSFADLMARAPVFNKSPFMEVVGGNAGLAAGLAGQTINSKTQLEGARIQTQGLIDIEKMRRKAQQPTVGDRLRAIAPALMSSFQGMGTNRMAGDLLALRLSQPAITPTDMLGGINGFIGAVNDNRSLQYPWMSGSQAGAAALLRSS